MGYRFWHHMMFKAKRMDASYTPVIHAIHISLYGIWYTYVLYIYIHIVIYRIIDHLLRWDAHGWLSELILFGSFWCQTSMFRRRDDSACLLSAALIHRTTPCALLTTHHVCILLLDRKTTHVCWMRRLNKKKCLENLSMLCLLVYRKNNGLLLETKFIPYVSWVFWCVFLR